MTIELSLRRRAMQSRLLAVFWLTLATIILVGASLSLPHVATDMLNSIGKDDGLLPTSNAVVKADDQHEKITLPHAQVFVMVTVGLGFFGITLISFLLGRASLFEMALAARHSGLADALCIVGSDIDELEKAASFIVPKPKHLSVPEILSEKDIKEMGLASFRAVRGEK
jgi:hypothetical protein